MSAINRLIRVALRTFQVKDGKICEEALSKLKSELNSISAGDIGVALPGCAIHRNQFCSSHAPALHIHIHENESFSVGVFILKEGKSIPLHDHPGMTGICKVLYGTIRVKSYDVIDSYKTDDAKLQEWSAQLMNRWVPTLFNSDRLVTCNDDLVVLNECSRNYHSIEAESGPAAFLDILSPPYDESENRDCSYYKIVPRRLMQAEQGTTSASDIDWLVPIAPPREFFCSSLPYTGPIIDEDGLT